MEFLHYIGAVFTPYHFAILCFGTIGGLILGALPGVSPTMAVALLIPFTFHMEPSAGLILLGAAYTATVAGGAVSAILLKIPGAPANIATVLDGHQMAKNGDGRRALQICFVSSGVGGVIGILVLIFFTPVLARWALAFGPSHLFWMAMLGVTVIASLGTKSVVKGMISGVIGLWISTIGFDQIHGVERFVFSEHLMGGIHTIAALVGLFALPQVLQMLERKGRAGEVLSIGSHPIMQTARDVFRRVMPLSIGSVVGVIVGLIPGAGGQIAGLVSYDQTRKLSAHPEKFGTGEPDGVIAAESANNAMVGPSLVPLLTLSVPGSPTAAVLLGGLLIHGIFPGADLFENYPEVTWTFINSLLVGQILMVIFGLWLSGIAARVIRLPEHYLAAGVMVLAVFGTYSVQHSYSDVLVMASLGIGMYMMQKFGYTAAPIVLGIVLGPIAERNFMQGRIIANAGDGMLPYFFGGALNIALIALIVMSVASSLYYEIKVRRKRSAAQAQTGDDVDAADAPAPAHSGNAPASAGVAGWLRASAGDIAIFLLSAVLLFASFGDGKASSYLFPRMLAAILLLFCVVKVADIFLKKHSAPAGDATAFGDLKSALPFIALIVGYILIAEWLGFYAAAALAYFCVTVLGAPEGRSRRDIARASAAAVGVTIMLYILFSALLQVQSPRGILF